MEFSQTEPGNQPDVNTLRRTSKSPAQSTSREMPLVNSEMLPGDRPSSPISPTTPNPPSDPSHGTIEQPIRSPLGRNHSTELLYRPQTSIPRTFNMSTSDDISPSASQTPPYTTIRRGHASRLSIGSIPSRDNSPLSSVHSSTSSFLGSSTSARNSSAPPISSALLKERPGMRELSSSSTVQATNASAPTSAPTQAYNRGPEDVDGQSDYPTYPNQAFAALQSQVHPSGYPPLRNRNSQLMSYSNSAVPTQKSTEFAAAIISEQSSARTAGNTPASSPGLYTTNSQSAGVDSGTYDDSSLHSSPTLHWTQMREPRETHRVDIDVDPISGRKIIKQYEIVEELGRGQHGKVKLGRSLETGENVAIKIVERYSKRRRLGKLGDPEDKVKKEVAILKKARHENVVSLLEVIDDPAKKKVYIVLEYVTLGEIPWRTIGSSEIVYIEQKRIDRETRGIQEDEPTAIETKRILREAARRRAVLDKKCERQGRQDSVGDPYWSLEYVEEDDSSSEVEQRASEQDSDPATLHRLESSTSLYRSASNTRTWHASRSQTSTPLPHEVDLPPLDSDNEEDEPASSQPSHTSSAVGLPESAFSPPWSELLRNTAEVSSSNPLVEIPTAIEATEEEIYVPVLTLDQARGVFRDTILGLEYLHYQGIIHRDIKPANLLWTKDHKVKISDFGVSYLGKPIRADDQFEDITEADARPLDEAIELAKTVGTPAFYAPELCRTDFLEDDDTPPPAITGQIDVWALGVTLFCIVFARLPFIASDQFAMFKAIVQDDLIIPRRRLKAVDPRTHARPTSGSGSKLPIRPQYRSSTDLVYEDVDDDLVDLLRRLLKKDPSARITIQEIKRHPWILRDINDPNIWAEENDPNRQNEGRKIQVTHEDIEKAVIPITLLDRVRSSFRKMGQVIGIGAKTKDGRKRGGSTIRSADSPPSQSPSASASSSTKDLKQPLTPTLYGDEMIVTALKASRESDHPLSQSVTASPDTEPRERYFNGDSPEQHPLTLVNQVPLDSEVGEGLLMSGRPSGPDRAVSNSGASVKTIRASQIGSVASPPTSPGLPGRPTVLDPLGSSNLTGIFGGARRGLRRTESREIPPSEAELYRIPSVDRVSIGDEDPHAAPSIGLSGTTAAGHLDPPAVLKEGLTSHEDPTGVFSTLKASAGDSTLKRFPSVTSRPTTALSGDSRRPGDSSAEAFQRAQVENYRRRGIEFEQLQLRPVAMQTTVSQDCPPSPDDDDYYARRQSEAKQYQEKILAAAPMISSSSDDHFASSASQTSQSTSHPSIPSMVSAGSSVETDGIVHYLKSRSGHASLLNTEETVTPESVTGHSSSEAVATERGDMVSDEDPGYSGDHAAESDEEDSEDDDDFLVMSKGKPKPIKNTPARLAGQMPVGGNPMERSGSSSSTLKKPKDRMHESHD